MQLTSAICGTRNQQYGNPPVDRDCLPVTVIHIGLRECVQGYQQREYGHYLFHLVFFFCAEKLIKGFSREWTPRNYAASFPCDEPP